MKIIKYAVMIILGLIGAQSGRGAVITWNGSSSTTFSTAGNWVGGVAPANATGTDIGRFTGTIVRHPNITGARSINGLVFESAGWVLNGAGNTLTLGGSGMIVTNTASTAYIAPNVLLSGNQSWFVDSGAAVNAAGAISGSSALTKTGAGSLTLAGTYSAGALTVSAGSLYLGADDRIADTVAVKGGGGSTIFLSGRSDTAGAFSVLTGGTTINFGGSGANNSLAFATSAGVGWLGALTILNFESGVDSLRFGTGASGLTTNQLANIKFGVGGPLAKIDSEGFVTPILPPPTMKRVIIIH
jgi:fibronectin-binding autotransporter adhesin